MHYAEPFLGLTFALVSGAARNRIKLEAERGKQKRGKIVEAWGFAHLDPKWKKTFDAIGIKRQCFTQ